MGSGLPGLVVAAVVDLMLGIAESLDHSLSCLQIASKLPEQLAPWIRLIDFFPTSDQSQIKTKHNDGEQYIWESQANGSFTFTCDTKGPPLGRGTKLTLHLKQSA
jgi:hypothetical protein